MYQGLPGIGGKEAVSKATGLQAATGPFLRLGQTAFPGWKEDQPQQSLVFTANTKLGEPPDQ